MRRRPESVDPEALMREVENCRARIAEACEPPGGEADDELLWQLMELENRDVTQALRRATTRVLRRSPPEAQDWVAVAEGALETALNYYVDNLHECIPRDDPRGGVGWSWQAVAALRAVTGAWLVRLRRWKPEADGPGPGEGR